VEATRVAVAAPNLAVIGMVAAMVVPVVNSAAPILVAMMQTASIPAAAFAGLVPVLLRQHEQHALDDHYEYDARCREPPARPLQWQSQHLDYERSG
jgi:hypothetical protein